MLTFLKYFFSANDFFDVLQFYSQSLNFGRKKVLCSLFISASAFVNNFQTFALAYIDEYKQSQSRKLAMKQFKVALEK